VLSKHNVDNARTARCVLGARPPIYAETGIEAYGLGQWVGTYRGHNTAWHFGQMPGQTSYTIRLPDIGLGVGIMMNESTLG